MTRFELPAEEVALGVGGREESLGDPSDNFQAPWPWWQVLLWAGLMALAAAWQGPALVQSLRPREGDFPDFCQEWLSAQNLVHGRPVYRDQNVSVVEYTGHRPEWIVPWNAHPPTSVLLAVPLTGLDYPTAHLVWNVLSLAALAASLVLVVRQLARPPWMLLPALALLLAGWPLHLQLYHGQLNLVLLLSIVGTWALDRTGRPCAAGTLLGVAVAIKLFPAFLFVYFVARRRWRAVGAGVVCLVVLTALTVAAEGWESYRTYATQVVPHVAQLRSSWLNDSLAGFSSRLFDPRPIGGWHVLPLWRAPSLARAATGLGAGLVLALLIPVAWRARRRAEGDRAFALAVTAMLLVSPITWDDYFLLLLLPVVWLWPRLAPGRPPPPATRHDLLLLLELPLTWLWPRLARVGPRWTLAAALVVLSLPPNLLYLALLGLDPLELDSFLTGRTATAWQSLTLLSVPFYALLGLLVLVLLEARRRGAAAPAESPSPAREKGRGARAG